MHRTARPVGSTNLQDSFRWAAIAVAVLATATLTACNSGPARVNQPYIDASGAGDAAMEQYDTNGDGIVNGAELDKAAGLKAALPRLDANGDQGVSSDEVAARINAWKEARIGLASVRCHVTLDGKPLSGAKVTFEPESFLGNEIKTAFGETNLYGDVSPTIPRDQRPDPNLPGSAHFGLYKVRISKSIGGSEKLPARYNTETTLGQEVSNDDPGVANNNVKFVLKSD